MSRKALSYLLLVLISLQSVTAMADMHPIDYLSTSFTPNFSYSYGSSPGMPEGSTVTDPTEQNTPPDSLFHCHHHGCHCHVYLSSHLTQSDFLPKPSLHNDYHAIIPEAPTSSLYRPPIV
ncbi:hypothetical protein G3485_22530 [Shewanella baltica]|uniref:hypothetical protein n=1 Tax=Shewanella baltica TaxID=62322 RepID=UPI002168CDE7|nr:hypothetical protein [Shewanella baltica]MCS6116974.1 hypothetical protein [Shewanella baltica]MCS6129886.1 hypothetical protein [Shewanella baltica]MCS6141785.1 hypothetical protein [Shewanella baltica]MCS6148119.1 hypothetical protein [Shewanella baltica]MCS6172673.1 hypothetical protein [Shewanella baltica]